MVLLTVATGVMFLCPFLIVIGCHRSLRHRRNAQLVLPVRPVLKILAPISAVALIVVSKNLPSPLPFAFSLFLVVTLLSSVLIFFCTDVIIENDGVYFGLMSRPLPWERIKSITNYSFYLMIIAHRKRETKGFVKFIWKIKDEDVKRLEALFSEKKKLNPQ